MKKATEHIFAVLVLGLAVAHGADHPAGGDGKFLSLTGSELKAQRDKIN